MDENELHVMDDETTEKGKNRKSLLIPISVGLVILAFVGILAGGIIGGTKYLASKGIIEEPEFLKAFGASDYDVTQLSVSNGDTDGDQDSEGMYGQGNSGVEGSLFDSFDSERTAMEAALNGKDADSDFYESSESDTNDAQLSDDISKENETEKANKDDSDNEKSGSNRNTGSLKTGNATGNAKRTNRIAKAISANNMPLVPGFLNPAFIKNPPYNVYASQGSSSGSSGSSSESSSGSSSSSSSGSSSGGGSSPTPTPTPIPTPTPEPTPTPSPTPLPTPTPFPAAINKSAKVATKDDVLTPTTITTEIETASTKRWSTVMVYLCGTDLEDNSGQATAAILDMLSSQYDMNKVNVLICAGGTNTWKNDYMGADTCASVTDSGVEYADNVNNDNCGVKIYKLNNLGKLTTGYTAKYTAAHGSLDDTAINASTLQLLGSCDAMDMGNPELLTAFINFSTDYYPAYSYDLIMWNHGGGVTDGVCSSDSYGEDINGTTIEIAELEDALRSTDLYESGNKLDLIGFDACLMSSAEIAYNLSPYCNYMIGSEEVTSCDFDYKNMLLLLSQNGSLSYGLNNTRFLNAETATKIADYYYQANKGDSSTMTTIACMDLSETGDLASALNEAARSIENLWDYTSSSGSEGNAAATFQATCYQAYKQARIHSLSMQAIGYSRDDARDYVDLASFLSNLKKYFGAIDRTGLSSEEISILNSITTSITAAQKEITAASGSSDTQAVIASGINFDGKSIYNNALTLSNSNDSIAGVWNDFNGSALSGISVYVPYYSLSNYSKYSSMDILDDLTELNGKYAAMASTEAETTRIKRLASVIDYGKILKTSSGNSYAYNEEAGTDGYLLYNTKYKNYPYYEIEINDGYADGNEQSTVGGTDVSSGDPFTDLMDTVEDVKAVVTASAGTGESSKVYEIGSKSVGIGVIQANNETIAMFSDVLNSAVSKINSAKVYYIDKNTSSGEAEYTKDAYVNAYEGDDADDIIKTLIIKYNESVSAQEQITVDSATTSNYAIFSGKCSATETSDDGSDTATTTYSNVTHVFSFDTNGSGTYLGTFVAGDPEDGTVSYSQITSPDAISFISSVIESHGVELTDTISYAVSDFSDAYKLCRTTIEGISKAGEAGVAIEIDSIIGEDEDGNPTAQNQFILSSDTISIDGSSSGSDGTSSARSVDSDDNSDTESQSSSDSSDEDAASPEESNDEKAVGQTEVKTASQSNKNEDSAESVNETQITDINTNTTGTENQPGVAAAENSIENAQSGDLSQTSAAESESEQNASESTDSGNDGGTEDSGSGEESTSSESESSKEE